LLARLTLAVLMLGSRPTRHGAREADRSAHPEVLASLQEAGLIDYDPARRTVSLTDVGVVHAQRLLRKLRTL
jgi:ribosomal protein S19E (S16A)